MPVHSTSLPIGTRRLRHKTVCLLAAACCEFVPSATEAQDGCEIEEVQRLFGENPRQTAEVERLLAECLAVGSKDYRIFMLRGVIARDSGDRRQAIVYLRQAHEIAPEEPNPALELAFTLEDLRTDEAREIYERLLGHHPASRPAMLGLARVARSQNRLSEAGGIYERLLVNDPADADALNGTAWLKLASRRRESARAGFEQVLEIEPSNQEALAGLSKTPDVYRYKLEASGLAVSTERKTTWGFEARGTAAVSAFDQVEVGWRHFNDPLLVVSEIGLSALPSEDITVGYHRLVPLSYAVSLVYDYRQHGDRKTEHWIDGSATVYLADGLQWFGAYRRSFGDDRYDGRLIRTGLSAGVARDWHMTVTGYNSRQVAFRDGRSLWSGVVDATYTGPRNTLLVVGVGTSPLINNLDLHARAIVPATDRIAMQLIASHDSYNTATSIAGGLTVTW